MATNPYTLRAQQLQDQGWQKADADKQQAIAPLAQASQAAQTRLALFANPDDPTKPVAGKEAEYAAAHDQLADIIGKMRTVLHPPPPEDPHGLGYLAHRVTDKLHITNDLAQRAREAQTGKVNNYYQQGQQAVQAAVEGAQPYQNTPQAQGEAQKQKDALALANAKDKPTLKQYRLADGSIAWLDASKPDQLPQGATAVQGGASASAATVKPLETGGVPYGVESGGKTYLASQMKDSSTPPEVRETWNTIQGALTKKQEEANKKQSEIESRFERGLADRGTWNVVEGDNGETKLLNSKTGEMKDAPSGLHKSGYFAKQIAPLEAANMNIDTYLNGKVFDGPGDLSLQHEFFTATQPSTGFRMTKVQQDILQDSQNYLNSAQAKVHHALYGTWFSDKQREQIANAAKQAINAKKASLSGQSSGVEGPKTRQLKSQRGNPANPVDEFLKNFGSQ